MTFTSGCICSFKYSWWWMQRAPEICREILQWNKIKTANSCISLDTHKNSVILFTVVPFSSPQLKCLKHNCILTRYSDLYVVECWSYIILCDGPFWRMLIELDISFMYPWTEIYQNYGRNPPPPPKKKLAISSSPAFRIHTYISIGDEILQREDVRSRLWALFIHWSLSA
jgi:hypothetical protein